MWMLIARVGKIMWGVREPPAPRNQVLSMVLDLNVLMEISKSTSDVKLLKFSEMCTTCYSMFLHFIMFFTLEKNAI